MISHTPRSLRAGAGGRRGFTLIEILIVGALLALFAGLAVFAAREMYESNRKKAMYDEVRQVGTALSLAHDDLGFFPRMYLLEKPLGLIYFPGMPPRASIIPAFDTYGHFGRTDEVTNVSRNWRGPYMPISASRATMSAGNKGMVRMRLMDADLQGFKIPTEPTSDPTLVWWPADTWGNPYMLYEVVCDPSMMVAGTNPRGLRLARRPGEAGNYLTAVVSYGPNHVPGGLVKEITPEGVVVVKEQLSDAEIATRLQTHGLYLKGDLVGGAGANQADYTLKSFTASGQAKLEWNSASFNTSLADSIESFNPNTRIGIKDKGSDDIYWPF